MGDFSSCWSRSSRSALVPRPCALEEKQVGNITVTGVEDASLCRSTA